MKIVFVGHASILVESQNKTILCDPWLKGKVFNNSWALVSPSSLPDFSAINYLWISHEHPDHFNFPSLKGIPNIDKTRIKILYQQHASPRIVEALTKLGFSHIIELPLYKWFRLDHNLEVFCGSVESIDSFIAIRDNEECILNLNDCVLNLDQLCYIRRRIGKVSGLFTQFSFANWVGNDRDEIHEAKRKIKQLTQRIDVFQPEFTVPFASFVYFCNEENARMNAWINSPDSIAQLKLKGVNFMYPGDEWDSASRIFNTDYALDRYRDDYANIHIDSTPTSIDINMVSHAIEQSLKEIKSKAPRALMRRVKPFSIYLHDLDKIVEVNPIEVTHRMLEANEKQRQTARYVMCSQVAWFTFAFSYGSSTTIVSGMYLDRQFAEENKFFGVQDLVSTEILRFTNIQASLRTLNFFWRKKEEIFYRFMGRLKGRSEEDADD